MQSILVINYQPESECQICGVLRDAGFRVQTTSDRKTVCKILHRDLPELLIFNLRIPGRDHWDLINAIRTYPKLVMTPIILITAPSNDEDKILGLELGVDDFLVRPISSRLVVARVKALLRRCCRKRTEFPQILHAGNLILDPDRQELRVDGESVDLTQAEFGLIRTFMGNPGYVFTRDELVENALGSPQEGKGRTLDTHIKNLRQKIEPDPHKPILIQTIYGVGYKLMAD